MTNVIIFAIVIATIGIIAASLFTRKRMKAAQARIALEQREDHQAAYQQRINKAMEEIRARKPAPSSPEYRATRPSRTSASTETVPAVSPYDPSMDLMNPMNPLSPLSPIHSAPDPSPSYDSGSSHSAPDPSPSYDSGSSYGGSDYGGGGGGFDSGSSGGGGGDF